MPEDLSKLGIMKKVLAYIERKKTRASKSSFTQDYDDMNFATSNAAPKQ